MSFAAGCALRASTLPYRVAGWLLAALLCACGGAEPPLAPDPVLTPQAAIGRLAFHDPRLSAAGTVSCASCHDPGAAHGGKLQSLRTAQPLRYLGANTRFHYDLEDNPLGGYAWDGRAESPAVQSASALLGAREMGNTDKSQVVAHISRTAWAAQFEAVYGAGVLNDTETSFARLSEALEAFQREDAQFNGFTSKYDAVVRGEATLSPQEARGLTLFTDPAKGNCASCHRATPAYRAPQALFTNFGYANLGVPRNPAIAANADPAFYDLGLCSRGELRERTDLCGFFRTPSLRNVVLRQAFFHNGRFTTLQEAIEFKVKRESEAQRWYPGEKYDDMPAHLRGNVKPVSSVLSDSEIQDVMVFLHTLTDGWK